MDLQAAITGCIYAVDGGDDVVVIEVSDGEVEYAQVDERGVSPWSYFRTEAEFLSHWTLKNSRQPYLVVRDGGGRHL